MVVCFSVTCDELAICPQSCPGWINIFVFGLLAGQNNQSNSQYLNLTADTRATTLLDSLDLIFGSCVLTDVPFWTQADHSWFFGVIVSGNNHLLKPKLG